MDLTGARCVAVLAAMVPELQPIVHTLTLRPIALDAPRAFAGRSGRLEIVAAVTAMGTRAARDVTSRLLDAHRVDHVLVVGICGGIDRGRALGDLVIPEIVVDEASGVRLWPVPLAGAIARGTLMTTDVLHTDPAAIERFRRQGIVALDMETAAIGAVAEERGVPWSVFRAISDWAGDPEVDAALVGLSHPDGTANPLAVLRYVLRHPGRIPKLARLGNGLRLAVRSSTTAVLAALDC